MISPSVMVLMSVIGISLKFPFVVNEMVRNNSIMIGSVVAARALHCKTVPKEGILIHILIQIIAISARILIPCNFRTSQMVCIVYEGN